MENPMKSKNLILFSVFLFVFCFCEVQKTKAAVTSTPLTIQFKAGEISSWQSGYISTDSHIRYQLYAMASQNMIVSLGSDTGSAILGITDDYGTVYLSPQSCSSYWSMILPHTGYYYIDIYGPMSGWASGTNYAFQVIIPPIQQKWNPWIQPLPIQSNYQQNGGTIQFNPGTTSAVISGFVPANGSIRYSLYAMANQNFIVMLRSSNNTAVLDISDGNGISYLSAVNQYTYWNMVLPKTGMYYIDIVGLDQGTDFTFQVIIPARIVFPANTYWQTYNGSIGSYSVVSYSVYAAAGKTMSVNLNSGATPQAFLRISGVGTGMIYLDHNAHQTGISLSLPATQDYLVEVVSQANPAAYSLTVDIR